MLTSKRVEGEVEYNDGEFAEVMTIGIEGIEEGLLLETTQIHRYDTENTPDPGEGLQELRLSQLCWEGRSLFGDVFLFLRQNVVGPCNPRVERRQQYKVQH